MENGGPGRSRTGDKRFRKPLLYPSELQARFSVDYHSKNVVPLRALVARRGAAILARRRRAAPLRRLKELTRWVRTLRRAML